METTGALADLDRGVGPAHQPAARVLEPLDAGRRRVAPTVDGPGPRDLREELGQSRRSGRDPARQRLERQDVAVPIDDEAGERVTVAEDEADRVAVVGERLAEGPGRFEAAAKERVIHRLVVPGHESAHDLGPGVVEASPEHPAVGRRNGHRLVVPPGPVQAQDVGPVDPGVAPPNPRLALGTEDQPRHLGSGPALTSRRRVAVMRVGRAGRQSRA